jgi:hypothetical protein
MNGYHLPAILLAHLSTLAVAPAVAAPKTLEGALAE